MLITDPGPARVCFFVFNGSNFISFDLGHQSSCFCFLFLKGQNEALAGAEELISEGEVWGQDQVKMPTEQERRSSERIGSRAGLQPRRSN